MICHTENDKEKLRWTFWMNDIRERKHSRMLNFCTYYIWKAKENLNYIIVGSPILFIYALTSNSFAFILFFFISYFIFFFT